MKRIVFFMLSVLFLYSCKLEDKNTKITKETTKRIPEQTHQDTVLKQQFLYKPSKPIQGKLKAVVELGASGFNSFIINVDKDKNWEIKNKAYGSSLILDGKTTTKEIQLKLQAYIQKIVDFGVASEHIHFVISSGADKKDMTQLVKKELIKLGYKINVVTAEEEGQYALKSVMPKELENTAFVVDIGSGNTKISYVQGDTIVCKETFGSKYFQKNIDDNYVYNEVVKIAKNVPEKKRAQYFIIGGVPYQMAKGIRFQKERFTALHQDSIQYKSLIEKKGLKVKSGVNIFNAINKATNPKTIVFDWDSNFTIGFLLDLAY